MFLKARHDLTPRHSYSAPKLSSRFDPIHQTPQFKKKHAVTHHQKTRLRQKLQTQMNKYSDFMEKTIQKLTEQIRIKQYTHKITHRREMSKSIAKEVGGAQQGKVDLMKRREIQKGVIERIKAKQKNRVRRMFKEDLLKIVGKLKKYNISPKEVYSYNLFSSAVYVFGEEVFRSVLQEDYVGVRYAVLINRLVVYSHNHETRTPLICAAIRGNLEILKLLVDNNSIIQHKDLLGNTAVMYCSKYGRHSCLKYLITKGAQLEYGGEEMVKGERSRRMRAIDVAKDERTKKIIKMAKSVIELMNTLPERRREYFVESQYLRLGL